MSQPKLLDLYCVAGGASMGYHQAGFNVTGVDINPQKHYPFDFHQADAIEFIQQFDTQFDAIHASPPCQVHSKTKHLANKNHTDLIEQTRELLIQLGLPYVIENVPGAPLINPQRLEGQMFPQLRTHRPRIFETNWPSNCLPSSRRHHNRSKWAANPHQHNGCSASGTSLTSSKAESRWE